MDFLAHRKYIKEKYFSSAILLRGYNSMDSNSDMDLLDDSFDSNEYSVNIEGVSIDKFKIYTIKRIEIQYSDLKHYVDREGCLLDPVEKGLFLLKDYIHLSKFRKEKHSYYEKLGKVELDFLNLSLPFELDVSNSIWQFCVNSIKLKIWYYGNLYLRSRWVRKD